MNEFTPILTQISPRPRRGAPQVAPPTSAKAESAQVPTPEVPVAVVEEIPEAAPS